VGPPDVAAALAPLPTTTERVARLPFVGPTFRPSGPFFPVRDDCPLTESDRRVVHEVATVSLALSIAASGGMLVFAPWPVAKPYLESGRLVEIPVRGWNVNEPVHVVCNAKRVTSRVRGAVVRAVRQALG
jgi:DNA-binding transcriptional LysR family regulator